MEQDVIFAGMKFQIPLFLRQVYEYITSSDLYHEAIFQDIGDHTRKLWLAALQASHALLWLIVYTLVGLLKLLTEIFPYVLDLASTVIEFHRTKLTLYDMMIEGAILALVLLYIVYSKEISSRWKKLELWLKQKSTTAAKILPHVMFFVVAIFIAVVGRKFLKPLTSPKMLPLFTIMFPLSKTIIVMYNKRVSQYKNILSIWVVFAAYHSTHVVFSSLPFISSIPAVPCAGEVTVVISLWVQASPVCTDIVKTYTGPLLIKLMDHLVPLAKVGGDNEDSSGGIAVVVQPFVFVLKSAGFLSEEGESMVKSLLQDSISFFVCVFFLFMPGKLANIGLVLVGFVIPAYNTSFVTSSASSYTQMQALKLESTPMVETPMKVGSENQDNDPVPRQKCAMCDRLGYYCSQHSTAVKAVQSGPSSSEKETPKAPFSIFSPFRGLFSPRTPAPNATTKVSPSVVKMENSIVAEMRWMEYWTVFAFVWIAKLNVHHYVLWPSMLMVTALYLQHSYFKGASKVISFIFSVWRMMLLRNYETQLQRKLDSLEDEKENTKISNNIGVDDSKREVGKTNYNDKDVIAEDVAEGYSVVEAVSEATTMNGGTPIIADKLDKNKTNSTTGGKRSSKKSGGGGKKSK